MGTTFSSVVAEHPDALFLIIESNQILKEITPDLAIFLPAEGAKPSAMFAVEKADIVRGQPVSDERVSVLAIRLGCEENVIRTIIELVNGTTGAPARP